MKHIGLLCPPVPGHLNPMCALGRALSKSGHRVTLVIPEDLSRSLKDWGGEQLVWGQPFLPAGSLENYVQNYSRHRGLGAVSHTIQLGKQEVTAMSQELPEKLSSLKLDLLIADKTTAFGSTLAEILEIPFVTLMASLFPPLEEEVPPVVFNWSYRSFGWRWRNRLGNGAVRLGLAPIFRQVNHERRRLGLKAYPEISQLVSPHLQLSQLPSFLRFGNESESVCHLGPLVDGTFFRKSTRAAEELPLDGKPLLLVSLGTLAGHGEKLLAAVGAATKDLNCQVLMVSPLKSSFDHVICRSEVDQWQVLKQSAGFLTHCGLNSALEALCHGVPIAAYPQTQDQPGVTARLVHHQLAVPLESLSFGHVQGVLQQVLSPSSKTLAESVARKMDPESALNKAVQLIGDFL